WENDSKKAIQKKLLLRYKKGNGQAEHALTAYFTDHGPVVGKRDDNWLSLKSITHSTDGLIQSWQRMKATDLESFKKILNTRTNSTTNTLFADDKGNTAYWHGNFIPRKNSTLNYDLPVDGTSSVTDWKGAHELNEIVHIINPKQGFIQNCNSTPFSVSGFNSIDDKLFPEYMAPDGENFRSLLAIQELEKQDRFTLDQLIGLGYNNYLSAFDTLLPPLFAAYDALPANNTMYKALKEPIELLKQWDKRTSATSTATTLAIIWAYNLLSESDEPKVDFRNDQMKLFSFYVNSTSPHKRLLILFNSYIGIKQSFSDGKMPWGELNRYQRKSGKIQEEFSDSEPSLPSPYVSSLFGCLPAYESTFRNTQKLYGYAGNSFVAAVEFGKKLKAKAISPGGQSFDPASKHFNDQTPLFLQGKFRDVFFYKEDVEKNKERSYKPGE
ncbi:MAG: penicillin acylase family protein, partial [Flavisolibacter sp.]